MDAKKIGAFIAALRKSAGYTQQEVAGRLGLTDKTVSKWETGGGLPDITILPTLAELFGVTADELLAGERLTAHEREDKADHKTAEQPECLPENNWASIKARLCTALGLALCGLLLFFILSNTTYSAPISCGAALIFCIASTVVCFHAVSELIRTASSNSLVPLSGASLFERTRGTLRLVRAACLILFYVGSLSLLMMLAASEYGGDMPYILRANGLIHLGSLGIAAAGSYIISRSVTSRIR